MSSDSAPVRAPRVRLARAGRAMAAGTLASRGTGFLRTIALLAALGTTHVADAYNIGNTLPNIVYDLLLGGILSSVVVPLLVQARREDADGGRRLASALVTVVVVGLSAAAILGVLAAPLLVDLYVHDIDTRQLAVEFTRFFLPQVIFYGLTGVLTAILNTRGKFGAPTVVPVLNNLVLLITVGVFFLLPGAHRPVNHLSRAQTLVLGLGTTAGVVVMALALVPALRGTGLRLSWRAVLEEPRLRQAGRLGGWILAYAVVNQIGYLFVTRFASPQAGAFTKYSAAYQLFQLPHAVVAVSVISALLPRMSGHAGEGNRIALTADLSRGLRLTAVMLLPAALVLIALGQPLAEATFHYGATSYAAARTIGDALAAFAVGLPAFSAYQLLLRAFYASQDSRTPALINVAVNVVNVGVDALVTVVVPAHDLVTGLALGLAASYLAGSTIAVVLLRRRLLGIDGYRITRLVIRSGVAGVAAAVVARVSSDLLRAVGGPGQLAAAFATVVGAALALLCYLAASRGMRVDEVEEVLDLLPTRAQSLLGTRRSP